mmetsp:Transcript_18293/g.27409  ORF Transcript_18293/g.27409 Transcript_18293/m.27409 type:complete len:190 (-) Transcript_18293:73-642(-)|eukprot:CAMPEP_0167749260 /NCGR_PEP_ID=MMETSP0110_2-20121227/5304_1 /TAXON_ID=629695 /ORGANISM="Gymnochlora sp., Strain CCMP2014" /LENGTH=189 /DNA_ID=CAMNT_0007634385 /DNA_START=32 /DNA_END=601 /DNA_ORIENTATION=-
MVKTLLVAKELEIPPNFDVKIHAGKVTVTLGEEKLVKCFKHAKMQISTDGKKIYLKKWMSNTKSAAVVRTIASHINNMFTGLKRGYQYKMRLVYNHFPIQASLEDGGTRVEIRNFVGQKMTKICKLPDKVTCRRSEDVKDELVFEGPDIQKVSQAAAQVHQLALVRNKDIRKFLDGIYVSEKGFVKEEE